MLNRILLPAPLLLCLAPPGTAEVPLLLSTTPDEHFHTWRYSSWLLLENEWRVYAEVAKPNRAHEIRLFRVPR